MAIWEVKNMEVNTKLFNNVFRRYCWSTGYLWSVNTLLNINLIGTEHEPSLISIIVALEYSGTQLINMLPEDTRHKATS